MRFLSLFAGIGGLDLGLERAGMTCVGQVEIDPFCRRVLAKHWPNVWRHDDVTTLTGEMIREHCGRVDCLCGGFPCQDVSTANKGAVGIGGKRSGLWSEYARLVREVRPRYVVVENVTALLDRGLGRVVGDLAAIGYDAEWDCLPSGAFGSPHFRDRVFVVAYPHGLGMEGEGHGRDARLVAGRFEPDDPPTRADWTEAWAVECFRTGAPEPFLRGAANGLPDWMDRVRAIGNAVAPAVAEWVGRRLMAGGAA